MAKSNPIRIKKNPRTDVDEDTLPTITPISPDESEADEEVEEVDEEPQVEEAPAPVQINAAAVAPIAFKAPEKLRISVFREISPAPRIGSFSFEADMNMPVLKVGTYEVPYNVAMVLVDKKIAQIV